MPFFDKTASIVKASSDDTFFKPEGAQIMRTPLAPFPVPTGCKPLLPIYLALAVVLWLASAGCERRPDPAPSPEREPSLEEPGKPTDQPLHPLRLEESDMLILELSEGETEAEAMDLLPEAHTEPLSDSETQRLLSRLPTLEDPHRGEELALPPDSRPRPRTGETIEETFPPRIDLAPPAHAVDEPLRVERYAPEGAVPLAPHVSVTFSQPMVAVTSHEEAGARIPVQLSPELPGRWRWVGTRTLLFELEGRLPMATSFEAVVPAGTRSATGAALAEEVRWGFETPPPSIESFWPSTRTSHSRETVMVIVFDQRVDREAVLDLLQVRADRRLHAVTEATEEEIERFPEARRLIDEAEEGRWLALRPVLPLPYDSSVTVEVPTGTPSAEGPRRTEERQSRSFRTYGPFRVTRHHCHRDCPPGSPWSIRFSNPIDLDSFDENTHVEIEPELPMKQVRSFDSSITILGLHRANTDYTVRLSTDMTDVFGQSLERTDPITFSVGPTRPRFTSMPGTMVVLDPAGSPEIEIHTQGYTHLDTTAYAVEPTDWPAYSAWRSHQAEEPPGRRAFSRRVRVAGDPDEMSSTPLNLEEALEDGLGQVVLHVKGHPQEESSWRKPEIRVWIQRTKVGLMAWHGEALDVLAMGLETGEPVEGASLSLLDSEGNERPGEAMTDAEGRATLSLFDEPSNLLIARSGSDMAILPARGAGRFVQGWKRQESLDRLAWYFTDDRQMYRPGEEAHFKGWVRVIEGGAKGDIESVGEKARAVSWQAIDPRGSELAKGESRLDRFGGFSFALDIPEDANLGHATIILNAGEDELASTHRHRFQIQSFRRPEFEVEAKGSEAPHLLGEPLKATVEASYYTGEPLTGAEVTWMATSQPGTYRPPGHRDFTFGRVTRPWGWRSWGPSASQERQVSRLTGTTASDGTHVLDLESKGGPPFPVSLIAQASVMDVNRQSWSASVPFLIHPAKLYVGLSTEARFISRGQDLEVDLIVTDIDGKMVPDHRVALTAERTVWKYEAGKIELEVEETRTCENVSSEDAVTCAFESLEGGRWHITATVVDERGRPSRTEMVRWVSGGPPPPRIARVEQEEVMLIPDKDEYEPKDVARVLAQLPFQPAEMIITWRREGVLNSERLRVEGPDHEIEVPITDAMTPGVELHVAVAGTSPRTDASGEPDPSLSPRPAFGYGSVYLSVPPAARTLQVEAEPATREIEPGGSTRINIAVRDSGGAPIQDAQVLLVAVDEAILALTDHKLPDPIESFYRRRPTGVGDTSLYPFIILAELDVELTDIESSADALSGEAAEAPTERRRLQTVQSISRAAAPKSAAEPAAQPIAMRTDLSPLALFAPAITTGADGLAQVDLDLPDNLTRYRIMAVATDGERRFGSGESTLTARLPLMVRPSLPRFFNLGDYASLPFVVQNQTDEDLTVALAARSAGLALANGMGRRFQVPSRSRVEVRIPGDVRRVGPATVQVAVSSGSMADAAEITLPVWTPVTSEAFATYGTIDDGPIRQPVEAPPGARLDFGGLELTTSSTELQSLTDAVVYLSTYPFNSTEQVASRLLALSALLDVLEAFEAEGLPPPSEIEEALERDMQTLLARQGNDGSFGVFRRPDRNDPGWPYLTVHVTLALTLAKEKGLEVPSNLLLRSTRYLGRIENYIPDWYSQQAKWTIRAAALYTLARGGSVDGDKARALLSEATIEGLHLEALGWLLYVLAGDSARSGAEIAAIERHLLNRVTETSAGATFATRYEDGAHLLFHSSRRTDAVLLEGLMAARPQSDLIVKTVRGLLAHRSRGRWANTQENGWVLLALDRYFRQYEGVTPRFIARAWLGDRFAGEHRFFGRTTERHHISVPMGFLAEDDGHKDLTLAKEGPGRMYYRVGLRYVPDDLTPPPADHGFTVERTYEAIDDPDDVRLDDDGVWRVRAGAPVRVRLTLVAPSRRYHVALVDRLPAGFEPLNPALAVTGAIPPDTDTAERTRGRFWFWWRTWYEHQNLRDERAEAFASLLWPGVHSYSYVARATTPGRFIAPPPSAEEMYHPETFGRGAGEIVIVEIDPKPIAGN